MLVNEGKSVEVLRPTGVGRTADLLVEGLKTEIKTVSGLTTKDLSGAVASRIMDARSQAGDVIVDITGQEGFTKDLAIRAAKRAFGPDAKVQQGSRPKIKKIRIIGRDFDETFSNEN